MILIALALAMQPLSVRDSFRVGTGDAIMCTAQSLTNDRAYADMFDRGYAVTCRDASVAVGQLYALRARGEDPAARLAAIRGERGTCEAARPGELEGLGTVETLDCRLRAADVAYRVYLRRTRGTLYVAEGLSGYDSALRLGLRSLVADREVEGQVAIATTGAGDPAAFARVQASTLDPQRALAEAYRRNNAGNYADSFEFFNALTQRGSAAVNQAEVMVNEGLQKSNLGRYPEADSLFSRAEDLAGADPVTARRLRNYRAIQLADQGLAGRVVAVLDRPVPAIGVSGAVRSLTIDRPTAGRLSAESPGAGRVTGPWGGCEWERV